MSNPQSHSIPLYVQDDILHRRMLAEGVNVALSGKLNVVSSITLTPSSTSTTLVDSRISGFSFIGLMPLTAHAATANAAVYFTNQLKGSVTINHASSANTDQTFNYAIFG